MKLNIPFLDIHKINEQHRDEFTKKFDEVLQCGNFIYGENYNLFLESFKSYLGVSYAIGVGNGFDALNIIFKALIEVGKLNKGDEVIIPSNTFIASALPIIENGLTPIFIEPDDTFNIDFEKAQKFFTKKTKACLLVHLYGQTCWNEGFFEFCKKNKILLIEDCAQSAGAKFKNKKTGNLGYAAAFSFYPGKNLGALGDGGAITTNDKNLHEICQKIANYGSNVKYIHDIQGFNSRLDEIQAAFLQIKLSMLDIENQKRKKIASRYLNEIHNQFIKLPRIKNDHVFHLFVIRTSHRNDFVKFLKQKNIQTLIHYPMPITDQNSFSNHHQFRKIPNELHSQIVSIPISQVMTKSQVDYVIETINNFNV